MTRLTVTAKGQITLKQDLLKHLGVTAGQKIEADKLPGGRLIVRAAAHPGAIADFIGCLSARRGRRLTIDSVNDLAAQGSAKER